MKMKLIDKSSLLSYLVSLRPNEITTEYGDGWAHAICEIERHVYKMPTIKMACKKEEINGGMNKE